MAVQLRQLLEELCIEAKIDHALEVIETEAVEVDGTLVLLSECEDGEHLALTVMLEAPALPDFLDDKVLLRQLLQHAFDNQQDTFAVRFSLSPETAEPAATMIVPLDRIRTGAELMSILAVVVERAQEEYIDTCALAVLAATTDALKKNNDEALNASTQGSSSSSMYA